MIDGICDSFGSGCNKVSISNFGVLDGEWYLIDTTPLPKPEDITCVVYDILNNQNICFKDGKMVRNTESDYARLEIGEDLEDIIKSLKPVQYRTAIFDNKVKGLFKGQPLAFSISPKIDYINYPDHPHLNSPHIERKIPSSLCYTETPEDLGKHLNGNRMLDAMLTIVEWNFRHQIWSESRRRNGKGIWIGPQAQSALTEANYLAILDPNGRCRCGSNKKYKNCCYRKDKENGNSSVGKYDKQKLIEVEKSVFLKLKEYF